MFSRQICHLIPCKLISIKRKIFEEIYIKVRVHLNDTWHSKGKGIVEGTGQHHQMSHGEKGGMKSAKKVHVFFKWPFTVKKTYGFKKDKKIHFMLWIAPPNRKKICSFQCTKNVLRNLRQLNQTNKLKQFNSDNIGTVSDNLKFSKISTNCNNIILCF